MLLAGLAGCVSMPADDPSDPAIEAVTNNDPLEPLNRALYKTNMGVEYAVVGPLSRGYRYVLPQPIRDAVRNVIANASSPVVMANHILQGKFCRAGDTALRFLVNTTIGLGGSIDVADRLSIPAKRTDFGITLGSWGVSSGPYLYLPVLTSTDLRDLGGLGVDIAIDPWSWAFEGVPLDDADWGLLGGQVVDTTDRWTDWARRVQAREIDPYVAYRSMYLQYRLHRIELARAPDSGVVCGDSPAAE